MRAAVLVVIAIFVAVPALLTLFQPGKALVTRLIWTVAIFISPFVVLFIVGNIPALNGQAVHDPSFWRSFGVLFSTAAFILPWCLYAILNRKG
jgi:hypothetical protein